MLWLARDGKGGMVCVFAKKPHLRSGWWGTGESDREAVIRPHDTPIKLKPGEGPVKVKLVKA